MSPGGDLASDGRSRGSIRRGYRPFVDGNAALVLAAGSSRRLGSPKQLVDLGGRPLLDRVVGVVAGWPVELVVVVLGANADAILDRIDFGDAIVAVNDGWEEGLASSLRVGFDILTRRPRLERTFIVLGDQPHIPPQVPEALLEAAIRADRPAIVPVYRYQRGNPVLFDRSLWPRLMTLAGDSGASALLLTHPEWVEEIRFSELPPQDVDTPEDVADLRATERRGDDDGASSSR